MPTVKFNETAPRSVTEILGEKGFLGNKKMICVPMFQRNYSWKTEDKEPDIPLLWNDLFGKYNDMKQQNKPEAAEYLLGPMVFVDEPNTPDKIEIIDGQQRLATLTMILACARDIIAELYDCKQSSMPPEIVQGFNALAQMIENRKHDVATSTEVHDTFKLELNNVDKMFFKDFIQKYEPEHTTSPARADPLCESIQDEYKRISKKIAEISIILKKKKEDRKKPNGELYQPSEILMMQAYKAIHGYIDDALVTNFKDDANAEELKEQIEKDANDKVLKEMKISPGQFGIPTDFFNDGKYGLDVLEKQNWDRTDKVDIDNDYSAYKNRTRAATPKTFDEWIEGKITDKKTKKFSASNAGKFKDILLQEVKNEKKIKTKTFKTQNLTNLLQFCKIAIGERVFSVRVLVKDDEDAFQIFETLNVRGQPLGKSNLVKNWIIKNTQTVDQEGVHLRWDEIFKKLGKNEKAPDNFLRESLRSRGADDGNGEYVFDSYELPNYSSRVKASKNLLYTIIKNIVKDHTSALQFVKDLEYDVLRYRELSFPKDDYLDDSQSDVTNNRDVKQAIIDMDDLGAELIRLPILCAERKWGKNTDSFKMLVKFLVPFFFRYKTMNGGNASKLEAWLLKSCAIIQNGANDREDLEKIVKFLLILDEKEEFDDDFQETINERNDDIKKYTLKKFSEFLANKYDDKTPIADLDLEHILPQKPLDDGSANAWDVTKFWTEYDKNAKDPNKPEITELSPTQKKWDRWYKKIGNLTLLKQAVNVKVSNYNFVYKRDLRDDNGTPSLTTGTPCGYASSLLEINKETVVKDPTTKQARKDWDAISIIERGKYLADAASKIWALPMIICVDPTCPGHKKSIDLEKETIEKAVDMVEKQKCIEMRNGTECGKDLQLIWPKNNTVSYKVPSSYTNCRLPSCSLHS